MWESISFLILFLSAPEERLPHCTHAEDKWKGPKQFKTCARPSMSDKGSEKALALIPVSTPRRTLV